MSWKMAMDNSDLMKIESDLHHVHNCLHGHSSLAAPAPVPTEAGRSGYNGAVITAQDDSAEKRSVYNSIEITAHSVATTE
ncbi:hypothetical protein VPNG_01296 [Cytospora leucostoma]|uniref:Uncharacterized protein n=1 Tax=Cytospora leucostoma TaxID=1230097 RepID=A0A423XKS1_9PEZI|nr:hypothetical protein VPNG_01296 [Cytospora leucostoma]